MKKIKNWIKSKVNILEPFKRYTPVFVMTVLGLCGHLMGIKTTALDVLFLVMLYVGFAIMLSGLAAYTFTNIKFSKELSQSGTPNIKKVAYIALLSVIFFSVCSVVVDVVNAVYEMLLIPN